MGVSRRGFLAGASTVAIGAVEALAANGGGRPLLVPLGGANNWIPRVNGTLPALYMKASQNRYYFAGQTFSDINSFFTAAGAALTRADTGESFNSSGLKIVNAINAPRFDYDPRTLVARGLRFRGARTNLCKDSANLAATSWNANSTACTRTANNAVGLDGTMSATTIVEDGTTAAHAAVSGNCTVTSGLIYCFWAKVKASGRQFARISDGNGHACYFDLVNVKTASAAVGCTPFIRKLSNGFFLIGYTLTTSYTNALFAVAPTLADATSSYAGDGVSGLIVDSLGLELGSYPSDLNPTSAATLTTSADKLQIGPTGGLPFTGFNASHFTILISGTASQGAEPTFNQRLITLDDGTTANSVSIGRGSGSGTGGSAAAFVSSGGTGAINLTSVQNIGDDRQFRVAAAWGTSVQRISFNGAPAVTGTGNSVLPTIDRIVIGNRSALDRGLFGCIDEVAIFPVTASVVEVQRLAKPVYPIFGFFTDAHYHPTKTSQVVAGEGTRVFTDTATKLTDAVAAWNARPNLDFIFQCGDFIEEDTVAGVSADITNLATIEALLTTATASQKHIDGNHDLWNLTKAQFGAGTGMPPAPYSFDYSGVHVVVLDGNFSSDDDASGYGGTGDETNAYVPPGERTWLTADLAATSLPTLVFCHYPFLTQAGAILANAAAVRTIFEASGKVFAVINGHAHTNGLDIVNGIRYYTMMALVESAYPANAYGIVTVNPNDKSVTVEGFGGQTSYA